jgi:hypothetical protein
VIHAAEQQRPDAQQARVDWATAIPELRLEQLVFIDETWASTNMTRRYGRCPNCQRLVGLARWAIGNGRRSSARCGTTG